MMHLVWYLFVVLATWDIFLFACHIPGVLSTVADAISRDDISLLLSKVPDADQGPSQILANLVKLVVTYQLDWTHPWWEDLFRNCLQLV